jgi:hypothetical protein
LSYPAGQGKTLKLSFVQLACVSHSSQGAIMAKKAKKAKKTKKAAK